jgi:cytochrome oxidase Cu insertion factor (SCO1/SenC/PrrC family)
MRKMRMVLLLAIAAIIISASVARADSTAADISLGELLMGDAVTLDDLKGQVVAVVFTGIN